MKKNVTQRNNQPGEIDLIKYIGIGNKSVHRGRKAIGIECPDNTPGQIEKHGRNIVCRNFGDPAEDDEIYKRCEQGLKKNPEGAQNGLLVARDDIPAHKPQNEFFVLQDFFQVDPEPALVCIYFPLPSGIVVHVI